MEKKICILCREDCSNEPRFKNDDGQYLHERCYQQSQQAATAAPPAPPEEPVAAPPTNTRRKKAKRANSIANNPIVVNYFWCQGRASRIQYWVRSLIVSIPATIVAFLFDEPEPGGLSTIVSIPFIYPLLMITIQRWHDRDKSGFWCLIAIIPIIGQLWAFIELGFLRGTEGTNRFGSEQ